MISIVISTNNEIRNNYLEKILNSISKQDKNYELIIVDNMSQDWTIEFIKNFKWIKNLKIFKLENSNRADRLNLWLENANWKIVLFHHSVSILPKNILWKIEKSVNFWNLWWWLSHSFDSNNLILKFTSWYSNNIRWWISNILYLDHCIFVEKKLAEKVWWFPEIDIFEDTIFSRRLKKEWKPIILKDKIVTSKRRFDKRWLFKQIIINQYLKLLFNLKLLNHSKMNKIYEKDLGFNVKYKK